MRRLREAVKRINGRQVKQEAVEFGTAEQRSTGAHSAEGGHLQNSGDDLDIQCIGIIEKLDTG